MKAKGETKEQNFTSIMEKTDIKDKKNFEIEKSKKQESIGFTRIIFWNGLRPNLGISWLVLKKWGWAVLSVITHLYINRSHIFIFQLLLFFWPRDLNDHLASRIIRVTYIFSMNAFVEVCVNWCWDQIIAIIVKNLQPAGLDS